MTVQLQPTLLMSLVNTPEASPNSVALALLNTPSMSLYQHHTHTQLDETTASQSPQKNTSNYSPVLEDRDDHDWTKGLLLGNEILVLHICEDSRLHEVPYVGNT